MRKVFYERLKTTAVISSGHIRIAGHTVRQRQARCQIATLPDIVSSRNCSGLGELCARTLLMKG